VSSNVGEPREFPTGSATIIFLHETEQLLGGSQLQRVVEIGAVEDSSETYFETRLPAVPGFNRQEAQIVSNMYAGAIAGVLVQPFVDSLAYLQDVNRAGALLDLMDIFWTSGDGSAEGVLRVRLAQLLTTPIGPLIAADLAPYL
jgi:hypothetical protein